MQLNWFWRWLKRENQNHRKILNKFQNLFFSVRAKRQAPKTIASVAIVTYMIRVLSKRNKTT